MFEALKKKIQKGSHEPLPFLQKVAIGAAGGKTNKIESVQQFLVFILAIN